MFQNIQFTVVWIEWNHLNSFSGWWTAELLWKHPVVMKILWLWTVSSADVCWFMISNVTVVSCVSDVVSSGFRLHSPFKTSPGSKVKPDTKWAVFWMESGIVWQSASGGSGSNVSIWWETHTHFPPSTHIQTRRWTVPSSPWSSSSSHSRLSSLSETLQETFYF